MFTLQDDDGEMSCTADTVIEGDRDDKHFTGLFTERGDPIYRLEERIPLGLDTNWKSDNGS